MLPIRKTLVPLSRKVLCGNAVLASGPPLVCGFDLEPMEETAYASSMKDSRSSQSEGLVRKCCARKWPTSWLWL